MEPGPFGDGTGCACPTAVGQHQSSWHSRARRGQDGAPGKSRLGYVSWPLSSATEPQPPPWSEPHPHSPFPGAGLGSPALSRDPHAPLWCAPAGDKRALASPSPQPPTGQVWDPQDPRPHGGLVTATQSDVHKLPNPRVCRPTAGALGIVPGQGRGCWANSPSHVPRGSGTRPGHTPGHRELERDMSWGWHSGWSCSHERGPNPATTETHRRQDRAHRAMPAQVSPPTTLGSIVTGPQTPELRAPPPGLHQLSVGGRGLSDTGQPAQSPGSQPKPA